MTDKKIIVRKNNPVEVVEPQVRSFAPNAEEFFDSALLSSFVHQVINPLGGVVGTVDNVISNVYVSEEKRNQKLRAAKAQLQHTIEMVRNMAYLATLTSEEGVQGIREKRVETSVEQVAIEAAQFFQESASQKGIRIRVKDPSTQHIVKAHKELFKHVFINLFDNAVKYSDINNDVEVSCRIQKNSGMLIVELSNVGIGFQHAEKDKIFNIGVRGVGAVQKSSSGSGLGLYICRRIVEAVLGGTIEAEHSNALSKTVFRIRIPDAKLGENYGKKER